MSQLWKIQAGVKNWHENATEIFDANLAFYDFLWRRVWLKNLLFLDEGYDFSGVTTWGEY